MSKLKYVSFALLVVLSTTANAVDYAKNQRQDRCVHISILVGLVLTVALVPSGAYVLTPNGAYNMQPSCPEGSPVQCCDPKQSGQNATSAPTNCTSLPANNVNCASPSVGYCFGATVPADLKYQVWAKGAGGSLLGVGLFGFIYAVGAFIQGCCWGTFCFG